MKSSILREIVRVCFFTPTAQGWGIPIAIAGQPGIGKTAMARQLGASLVGRAQTEVFSVAERGETGLGCVPYADADLGCITHPRAEWTLKFGENKPGFVFVDEITCADGELRKALLALVHDRRVGGHYLGSRTRIVAAYNPEGGGGVDTRDFDPAQANRFLHLEFQHDHNDLVKFLQNQDVFAALDQSDPACEDSLATETHVRAQWDVAYSAAALRVCGYLQGNPEHAHKMPKESDTASAHAWPSPRTWDMLIAALTTCGILGASQESREAIVTGLVGPGCGASYLAYEKALDLPDLVEILSGRIQFAHDPHRPDRTWVVLSACASHLVRAEKAKELLPAQVSTMWTLCAEIQAKAGSDVVLSAVETLLLAKIQDRTHPAYKRVVAALGSALRAAGVVS